MDMNFSGFHRQPRDSRDRFFLELLAIHFVR
jgi:hypothetical protein